MPKTRRKSSVRAGWRKVLWLPGVWIVLILVPGAWGAEDRAPSTENMTAGGAREARPTSHLLMGQVKAWHRRGVLGKGLKVAVLDSGFRGYRSHLGKALPESVAVRSFRSDRDLEARDSQHGILCAEVIHALAPDAEILFANWDADSPEQFLQAVQWACEQGARIISCSLIMPSWSDGEGNGDLHRALTRLLGEGHRKTDALFFVCAGNTAERHWRGPFCESPRGWHEWSLGEIDNVVKPWGSGSVSVELYWPYGSSYELVVWDSTMAQEVGRARNTQRGGHCCAVVRLTPETGHEYRVRVRPLSHSRGVIHLVTLGGYLERVTLEGSIPFPGDGAEVVTVGAVEKSGERASYSSCGANSLRGKPDLVAPVPFPSAWRDRPFSGTSAAAPQAAGLAALLWSRNPTWSAGEVRQTLTRIAHDLGPVGHDPETGAGLIALPALD